MSLPLGGARIAPIHDAFPPRFEASGDSGRLRPGRKRAQFSYSIAPIAGNMLEFHGFKLVEDPLPCQVDGGCIFFEDATPTASEAFRVLLVV